MRKDAKFKQTVPLQGNNDKCYDDIVVGAFNLTAKVRSLHKPKFGSRPLIP